MKGVTRFLEGLCSREGKTEDIFVFVMRLARWNQMHIGSVPWDNDPITVCWEDKWRRIVALDIRCDFECDGGF